MSASDFVIKKGVLGEYKGRGGDITIPDNVTSIGKAAFYGCCELTSVVIPDGVTSIGEAAFNGCERLTSVTIPDGVTSIEKEAFWYCPSLTSVTIPDSVTSIGDGAFGNCSSLTSVVIPDSVISIGYEAFKWCSSLTSVTIPGSVTAVGSWAFSGCKKLTSIAIPDSVTFIGQEVFKGCSSLTSVVIPDSVISIRDEAFKWCSSLTSVTIPDGVTSIGDRAFYGCSSLTSVTIPDGVTSIGKAVFRGCDGLKDADGFIVVHNVLYGYCGDGGDIIIPDSVTAIGYEAFGEWGNPSLTSVVIPDSVTTIGNCAFKGCDNLTSVVIPDSVTVIGYRAFDRCSNLKSVVIPDSVTTIDNEAFRGCERLTSVTIPARFAKQIKALFGNAPLDVIHISDIAEVSAKFRPMCAVGFAEDGRDIADENGAKFAKYIKANAAKLIGSAVAHPALFYLMVREKLVAAKDLDAVTDAVQASGNAELISAMLEYGSSAVSEKDKAKVTRKKEEREENVMSFLFDAEKLETLQGKKFVVTGKLKTFTSRDEFRECLETGGAILTESLDETVDYLITNTPNSGTAKNKTAIELKIPRITEAEFNEMIGRTQA